MTPERVKEIGDALYRELCGPERYKSDVSAIERAITQAVNEALSEAIDECNQRATVEGIAQDCAKAIDALKLPEEK